MSAAENPHTGSPTAPADIAPDAPTSDRQSPLSEHSAQLTGQQRRPSARVPRWAYLPFIAISIVHVVALALDLDALSGPTKLLLMPLLAFAVIVGARGLRATAALTLLLAGIGFSWLGDGAGVFVPFLPTLPMMLIFFGIAHIAYVILLWRHVALRSFRWWVLLLLAWWGGMLAVVGPHTGSLLPLVALYGLLLGLTAACATRCSPLVLVGGLFFLASDTILAFRLFMSDLMPDWTSPAVMLTYCLGQGLIAAGVIATLRRNINAPERERISP